MGADFAGGWTRESSNDPRVSLSRSGYTLLYAGCPILCRSQLQTTIALSTSEAEYIALSTAIRASIITLRLSKELPYNMPGMESVRTSVMCKVYEDNQSTVIMAKLTKPIHRSKHISTKYHHFRQYVQSKLIAIEHVYSISQLADIFTKPVVPALFTSLRKKLLGW